MTSIIVHGCNGKMGRAITELARSTEDMQVVCGVDIFPQSTRQDYPVYTAPQEIRETADVVMDFSRPDGLAKLLPWCIQHKVGLVLATTGFNQEENSSVVAASQFIPIFRASNMSVGVNVLRALAASAATALGADFNIEIVETHHNQKADAPSGTALTLVETITDALEGEHPLVYGRHGRDCKRTKPEIGIHALRGGTVTGEHQVHFFGHNESICLTHSAQSREVFAAGAIAAARFVAGKAPGIYGMDELMLERQNRLKLDCREHMAYISIVFPSLEGEKSFMAALADHRIPVVSQTFSVAGETGTLEVVLPANEVQTLQAICQNEAKDCTCTVTEQMAWITAAKATAANGLPLAALREKGIHPHYALMQGGVLSLLVEEAAAKPCMQTMADMLQ